MYYVYMHEINVLLLVISYSATLLTRFTLCIVSKMPRTRAQQQCKCLYTYIQNAKGKKVVINCGNVHAMPRHNVRVYICVYVVCGSWMHSSGRKSALCRRHKGATAKLIPAKISSVGNSFRRASRSTKELCYLLCFRLCTCICS